TVARGLLRLLLVWHGQVPTHSAGQFLLQRRRITIHSSRSRFAARLNSGVRRLSSSKEACKCRTALSLSATWPSQERLWTRSLLFVILSLQSCPRNRRARALKSSRNSTNQSRLRSLSGGRIQPHSWDRTCSSRTSKLSFNRLVRSWPDRRTSRSTPSRPPPNNSFKPRPLRGSA